MRFRARIGVYSDCSLLLANLLVDRYVPLEDEISLQRDIEAASKALIENCIRDKKRVRAVLARTRNYHDRALFRATGYVHLRNLSLDSVGRTVIEAHPDMVEDITNQIAALDEPT